MSRPFAKYPAKPTFGQVKEPLCSSDYIRVKKTKYSFCSPNICELNKNVYSQSNLLHLRLANNLAYYPCKNKLDPSQLYSNLYSRLDLSYNIPIISDLSGNTYPTAISSLVTPYLTYNIDASGNLFGNNICGINNYRDYITYNPAFL
jgi:hypothetical protein